MNCKHETITRQTFDYPSITVEYCDKCGKVFKCFYEDEVFEPRKAVLEEVKKKIDEEREILPAEVVGIVKHINLFVEKNKDKKLYESDIVEDVYPLINKIFTGRFDDLKEKIFSDVFK